MGQVEDEGWVEDVQEEGVVTADGIDRRNFMRIMLTGGAVVVGGLLLRETIDDEPTPSLVPGESGYDRSDLVTYPDRLSEIVAEGMESEWDQMALFPGIFTVTPGAKFYRDVMLTEEVDLGITGDNRGVIQRPVFPGATLSTLVGDHYEGNDLEVVRAGGIDSDTFAFFAPGVEGVVFANYQQSIESLQLHTRLTGGALSYNSETSANLPLQFIELADRREIDGAVAPIAEKGQSTEEIYEEVDESEDYVPFDERELIGLERHTHYFVIGQGRVYEQATAMDGIVYNFVHNLDPVIMEPDVTPMDLPQ